MGQNLRLLGIVAHPHDFTHFAGTLGVHTTLGDTATVVSMTAGWVLTTRSWPPS